MPLASSLSWYSLVHMTWLNLCQCHEILTVDHQVRSMFHELISTSRKTGKSVDHSNNLCEFRGATAWLLLSIKGHQGRWFGGLNYTDRASDRECYRSLSHISGVGEVLHFSRFLKLDTATARSSTSDLTYLAPVLNICFRVLASRTWTPLMNLAQSCQCRYN